MDKEKAPPLEASSVKCFSRDERDWASVPDYIRRLNEQVADGDPPHAMFCTQQRRTL